MRHKRIEQTLLEVETRLEQDGVQLYELKEQFGNLLEITWPSLAKATNEDKRQRFRDLLTNAATASSDPDWEEIFFASDLLPRIAPPGLAILAAAAKCQSEVFSI